MQPAHAPQTTVLIAVWDDYAGARLADAIASITRQAGAPRHLLIVDNASNSPVSAGADAEVIRTARRLTLGDARNFGLQRVTTPYVIVWDADDAMLPGTLTSLEAALDSDRDLVAFGAAIVEDPTGARHRWPRAWIARLARYPRLFALAHSVWSLYPTTGATIMRSDDARGAGGYGAGDSGEDWVLGVSLAYRGRVGWSERPGRLYRLHRSSVWAGHADVAHLLRHAREVRRRLRVDPAVPGWARAALPLIQLGQYVAIGLHLYVDALRRLRRNRGQRGDAGSG